MKLVYPFCILALVLISACSTTKSYPSKFYGYTPREQELIRNRQIAVGFDEDQVRMAWGTPNKIQDNSGIYTWSYTETKTSGSVIGRIGDAVARGGDPGAAASRTTFYDKLIKKVTFDRKTNRVISFNTY